LLASDFVGARGDAAHPAVLEVLEIGAAAGDDTEGHVDACGAVFGEYRLPDLVALLWVEEGFAEVFLLVGDEGRGGGVYGVDEVVLEGG